MSTNGQRVLLYLAAAIAGGIATYLITEVVIDRMTYGNPEEKEKDDIVVLKEEKKEAQVPAIAKPALADLVREYNPNPKEDGMPPIRIISEEEAYELMNKHTNAMQAISYYDGDGIFTCEDETSELGEEKKGVILEDPNELLPSNVHLMFDIEDSDTIYVWNEPLATIFVVTKNSESFNTTKANGQPKSKRRRTVGVQNRLPAEELTYDDGKKEPKTRRVR